MKKYDESCLKFTKKKYCTDIFNTWYSLSLSLLLITISNYNSNNQNSISSSFFPKFLISMLLFILCYVIYLHSKNLINSIETGKSYILAKKNTIYILKKISLIPLIIGISSFFITDRRMEFAPFFISSSLMILMKGMLDSIVTFNDNGYSSGFKKIKLNENMKCHEISTSITGSTKFKLYDKEKKIDHDKFDKINYIELIKKIKATKNI